MEELKIEKIEVVTQFKTSDGNVYNRKDEAELHEQYITFAEKVKKLKYVYDAYYCETQEDFDSIVDMTAYVAPIYVYGSNTYVPDYCYNKSDFKGPDWYFFEYEHQDNAADDYWVESLSEKKAEWDEFYNRFIKEDATKKGYVTESNATHKRITYMYPVKHDYSDKDHPNCYKYTCPVCDMLGNKHQVHKGETNCCLCNVNLLWQDE